MSDMQVVIHEKIRSPDEAFRKEREKMFKIYSILATGDLTNRSNIGSPG